MKPASEIYHKGDLVFVRAGFSVFTGPFHYLARVEDARTTVVKVTLVRDIVSGADLSKGIIDYVGVDNLKLFTASTMAEVLASTE